MVRAAMLRKVYDHLETLRVYKIYIRIIRTITTCNSRCAVPFRIPSNTSNTLRNPSSGMTRVSTSNRYVPGHSLTSPFFRWLRPEAIHLFVGSVYYLGVFVDGPSEGECRLPRCENPPYVFVWQSCFSLHERGNIDKLCCNYSVVYRVFELTTYVGGPFHVIRSRILDRWIITH